MPAVLAEESGAGEIERRAGVRTAIDVGVQHAPDVHDEPVQRPVRAAEPEAGRLARRERIVVQTPGGVGAVHALVLSEAPSAFNSA